MSTHLDLDDVVSGHPVASAELATLRQKLEAAERRAYEFEGRYEECRVGWVKEQDRSNQLTEKLEAAEKDADRWNFYIPKVAEIMGEPVEKITADIDDAIATERKP